MAHEVECPTCGKPVAWIAESRWRPFCSERCKLVDLGDWAAERHVIPGRGSDEGPREDDPAHPSPQKH